MPTEVAKVKDPTTFEKQIKILQGRGLIIPNEEKAVNFLKGVNYYRLSGYTLSLKKDDKFLKGVTIDTVYNLYEFDRKLRVLIMSALENIEIALRTHISYFLAHKYGARGYLNPDNFNNAMFHIQVLGHLIADIDRAHELFVDHHKEKYNGHFPIWVSIELLSFGNLSKLFSNMKNDDKKILSKEYYKVPYYYVSSWLRLLSIVRNICAHYGRLYNKKINVQPKLSTEDTKLGIDTTRIFVAIFVMKKLFTDKSAWNSFFTNLKALIEQYSDINLKLIGFSDNWEKLLGESIQSK